MNLRHYETFYLLAPTANDEERGGLSEKFQQIIRDTDGQIGKVDPWPLRKLAYKVAKQTHGYYVLMEYGAKAEAVAELTRNMRLDERVLKFVTVKKGDKFDPAAFVQAEETEAEAPAPEAATTESADA